MRRVVFAVLLLVVLVLASCGEKTKKTSDDKYKPKGDLETARLLYEEGKFAESEAELRILLKQNPNDVYAIYYMGFVSFQKTQFDAARKLFARALKLNPSTEFCRSIQELFLLETSKVIGSGKGFWQTPVLINANRGVVLAIMDDTDKDGAVSMLDNSALVHVQLQSRKSTILVDSTFSKGAAMPSPSGSQLVYASARKDTNGDGLVTPFDNAGIYMLNMETRKEEELIDSEFHNSDPVFSLDGKSIFFVSLRLDSNGDRALTFDDNFALFRYDIQTKETRKVLAISGDCRRPFLMDNDSAVLFWGINEDTNLDGKIDNRDYGGLYRYDLVTPKVECILSWKNAVGVFDYFLQGNKLIAVMDPDPGENVKRSDAEKKDPDKFGYGIYLLDIVTNIRRKILEPGTERFAQPTLAPDGHTIAFQRSNIQQSSFICYYYDMEQPYLSASDLIKVLKSAW